MVRAGAGEDGGGGEDWNKGPDGRLPSGRENSLPPTAKIPCPGNESSLRLLSEEILEVVAAHWNCSAN
jgi:hypothetical protein